jgi:iduronate 2-sulfatase
VPLIVAAPEQKGKGTASGRPVELVDLYPTLTDLCGVKAPENLAGRSMRPLLDDPNAVWDKPAITQTQRTQQIMGYSIRTERYRYTEWVGDRKELYDYENDPKELNNLATHPAHANTVAELAEKLHATLKR